MCYLILFLFKFRKKHMYSLSFLFPTFPVSYPVSCEHASPKTLDIIAIGGWKYCYYKIYMFVVYSVKFNIIIHLSFENSTFRNLFMMQWVKSTEYLEYVKLFLSFDTTLHVICQTHSVSLWHYTRCNMSNLVLSSDTTLHVICQTHSFPLTLH